MKLITNQQILDLKISPSQIYEWVSKSIEKKELTILPPKISLHPFGEVFYNTMPCILPYKNVEGIKTVNRYPGRVPALNSTILLHDLKNGNLKALMDGDYITSMRTGAVAVHSIRLFAKEGYDTLGFIGLGNTCMAVLDILLHVETEKNFKIKLYKYKDQAEKFIARYKHYKNLEFTVCKTYEEVIQGSHVVVSCVTVAKDNFCENQYFDKGCLVIPVHTRGFQNCDLFFDKIYGDDTGHICGFKYFNRFHSFAEVSDVVTGKKAGRKTNDERILVYNIGLAIHDIYIAEEIYKILSI